MQIGRVEADSGLREPGDDVLDHLETVKLMTVAGEIIELVAMHGTMTLGM